MNLDLSTNSNCPAKAESGADIFMHTYWWQKFPTTPAPVTFIPMPKLLAEDLLTMLVVAKLGWNFI
ncbi:MAG: hypothetical protein SGJ18_13325 [Pseudomonadota bacterium]|nr:hypothetical protein [Pseudomonadota bacterium]